MNEFIISIISFIILIIVFIYLNKNYKKINKNYIIIKTNKLIRNIIIITIIVSILTIIINLFHNDIKSSLINTLNIIILCLPLSLITIKNNATNLDEKYCHIKTIITQKIYTSKEIKELNKAGINIIICTKKNTKLKIKTITPEEYKESMSNKNLIIKTDDIKLIKPNNQIIIDKEENIFNKIKTARGIHDNYLRTIKINIITYIPLILSHIILQLLSFPLSYLTSIIIIYKIITIITSIYIINKLPYDTDIMERKTTKETEIISKQEILLSIFESLLLFIGITFTYMYLMILSDFNTASNVSISVFYTMYLYAILFITIINISEKAFVINLIKSLKNIRMIIYIILIIILSIIMCKIYYFNKTNYFGSILFALIFTLPYEITKLARYTTMKGIKKHGIKNNKKHKRS